MSETTTTQATPTTQTTKFKPVLMYKDQLVLVTTTNQYHTYIDNYNDFISECALLLERNLTRDEISTVLSTPYEFAETVKGTVINKFPFLNADVSFNMQALGVSFSKLESTLSQIKKNTYKYFVKGGKVHPEPKQIEVFQKRSEVYTQSPKQTELYIIAKTLIESANRLNELGVSSQLTQFNYNRATNQLIQNDTTNSLKINFGKILSN